MNNLCIWNASVSLVGSGGGGEGGQGFLLWGPWGGEEERLQECLPWGLIEREGEGMARVSTVGPENGEGEAEGD
jgi:hypothetical protein